ncbi:MAG: autotransporter-associated beta strand repeat-containing protein, partial [Kiritimatiellaeota bacterium]|nr:autotransporter-associated beta strand repeat-containing protein [Kiritimatiellota bacterium]
GGAGKTIQLGSLTGVGGTVLRAGGTQAGITTFAVGALGSNTTFAGQIQDGVNPTIKTAINKIGGGVLTLAGANTYSGGTTISGGTLALSGSGTLGSNSINVASGATLDAAALSGGFALIAGQNLTNSGTVAGGLIINSGTFVSGGGIYNGAVTNQSGGFLTPGAGGQTNYFYQSLTLASGSTNSFWIGSTNNQGLSVISNGLLAADASHPLLRLNLNNYTWVSGNSFMLYQNIGTNAFDGSSQYFQFQDAFGNTTNLLNNVFFSAVTGTGGSSATNLFSIRYDFNSGDGSANDILLTAIPEPASVNLLLMLGAVYWMHRRLHRPHRRWDS